MGKHCEITGKKRLRGHRVSHANNKTSHFQQPNIQIRNLFVPEIGSHFKLHISTSGLKILNRHGSLSRYLISANPDKLSARLKQLRKTLLKKGLSPFS